MAPQKVLLAEDSEDGEGGIGANVQRIVKEVIVVISQGSYNS